MSRNVFYALLVGTGCFAACLLMIGISVPLLGEPFQKSMFINGVLGCYGIGGPVTLFCLEQAKKLKIANAELEATHLRLAAAHAMLEQKVRYDHMTGLLNREYFLGCAEGAGSDHASNTMLIIDADHFKSINDRFGHMAGDTALALIARAIHGGIRREDVVGRLGGEEFGAFLPGADREQAAEIGERIRSAVEKLHFQPPNSDRAIPFSVSIGGVVSVDEATISGLMAKADRNLYRAKDSGRNRVIVETDLLAAA